MICRVLILMYRLLSSSFYNLFGNVTNSCINQVSFYRLQCLSRRRFTAGWSTYVHLLWIHSSICAAKEQVLLRSSCNSSQAWFVLLDCETVGLSHRSIATVVYMVVWRVNTWYIADGKLGIKNDGEAGVDISKYLLAPSFVSSTYPNLVDNTSDFKLSLYKIP